MTLYNIIVTFTDGSTESFNMKDKATVDCIVWQYLGRAEFVKVTISKA